MSALAGNRFPRSGYVTRSSSSGLADVLDVLLDKGLVIDIFLRVSLVGIELLTVDARIVIASVDTYLRFAEAVNRLDIGESSSEGLPDLIEDMTQNGAQSKTKGVLEGAKESLFGSSGDDDNDDDGDSSSRSKPRSSSRSRSRSSSRGR
ncbi:MAG TPA: gas vesicle protein GvpJ [Solirubrobacteraceae bacterium]|nr:gas vesicle protein GvpJ [Solirubrobacteraceae bacterium]